jgi:hypothetical protein
MLWMVPLVLVTVQPSYLLMHQCLPVLQYAQHQSKAENACRAVLAMTKA